MKSVELDDYLGGSPVQYREVRAVCLTSLILEAFGSILYSSIFMPNCHRVCLKICCFLSNCNFCFQIQQHESKVFSSYFKKLE